MDRPWSFAEKCDVAKRMARAGCSAEIIVKATELLPQTANSIVSRECPDYFGPDAFDCLKKNRKDD